MGHEDDEILVRAGLWYIFELKNKDKLSEVAKQKYEMDYYVLEFNTLLAGKEKVAMSKTDKKLYKLDEINNKLGDKIAENAVKNKVISKLVAEKKDGFRISLPDFDKNKTPGYIFFKVVDAYGKDNYFYLSLNDYRVYEAFDPGKSFDVTKEFKIDLSSETGKILTAAGSKVLSAEDIDKLPGMKGQNSDYFTVEGNRKDKKFVRINANYEVNKCTWFFNKE